MKKYHVTYKTYYGEWKCEFFEATCDTDARFTARMIYRRVRNRFGVGMVLLDFWGNYIDL